jgi:hypothetical protein
MAKFYYIVHATQSDNVGSIDAKDEAEAKQKLVNIYAPGDHKLVSVEIISKNKHDSEKKRIEEARLEEATYVASQEGE